MDASLAYIRCLLSYTKQVLAEIVILSSQHIGKIIILSSSQVPRGDNISVQGNSYWLATSRPLSRCWRSRVVQEDVLMGGHEYTWICWRNWRRVIKYSSQWAWQSGLCVVYFLHWRRWPGPFYLSHSAFKGPLEQTLSSGKKENAKPHIWAPQFGSHISSVNHICFAGQKIEKSKTSKSRLFSITCPTCLLDRRWLCLWQRREGTSFSPHCLLPSLSIHICPGERFIQNRQH